MRIKTSAGWLLGALIALPFAARADDESDGKAPPAYAPFEHLVGSWKGQGIPAKNRLKGWPEKHMWAWKFQKGKPVGMTVEITGGKIFSKAALSFDDKGAVYRLEGTGVDEKPVKYEGKIDESGDLLSLERLDPPAEIGKERIDLALNQNKIRYTLRQFRQEPDAPQPALVTEAGMGKEGESFAAGGAAADLPKCIVTGGVGTITVSFEGKSYPICCSGCRDEFQENPQKYVKKYLLRLEKGEAPPLKTVADTSASDEKKPEAKASAKSKGMTKTKEAAGAKSETKTASADKNDPATKAASILAQGQALEKAGKTQAAMTYFKRITKDYPDTPSAKTAKARIKALGGS